MSIGADSSSRISRLRASSGASSISILPPGNSHQPFHSPYPLCVASILPSLQIIAATTSICFMTLSSLTASVTPSRLEFTLSFTPSLTRAQELMGRGMLARYKIRGMPEPNDSTHATHCPLHRSSTSSILRYRVMHAAFLWAYRR